MARGDMAVEVQGMDAVLDDINYIGGNVKPVIVRTINRTMVAMAKSTRNQDSINKRLRAEVTLKSKKVNEHIGIRRASTSGELKAYIFVSGKKIGMQHVKHDASHGVSFQFRQSDGMKRIKRSFDGSSPLWTAAQNENLWKRVKGPAVWVRTLRGRMRHTQKIMRLMLPSLPNIFAKNRSMFEGYQQAAAERLREEADKAITRELIRRGVIPDPAEE